MDEQIKVSKFYIMSPGDPSVGIFDQQYEVGSDFYFENEEEFDIFKIKLKEAFEWVCDFPQVYTQEEVDKEAKRMAKMEEESMIDYHDENFVDEPMTDEELNEEIKKDWSLRK